MRLGAGCTRLLTLSSMPTTLLRTTPRTPWDWAATCCQTAWADLVEVGIAAPGARPPPVRRYRLRAAVDAMRGHHLGRPISAALLRFTLMHMSGRSSVPDAWLALAGHTSSEGVLGLEEPGVGGAFAFDVDHSAVSAHEVVTE